LITRVRDAREAVTTRARRLHTAAPRVPARKREGLAGLTRTLNSLSYLRVLDRGFSVVRDAKGAIIEDAASIATGDPLSIEFSKKRRVSVTAGEGAPAPKSRKPKSKVKESEQSDLFDTE
jgi:exodeoxyribonuclease VII large subunit